jgi:hypothetical protein
MRKLLLSIAVAATTLGAVSAAYAQPCGPGWRRDFAGRCRPVGPVVARPMGWRAGVWYPGRGWWDGRRFWRTRHRWQGRWVYR